MDTSKQVVLNKRRRPSSEDTTTNLQLTLQLADPYDSPLVGRNKKHRPSSSQPSWDVFLSFRGKDTRRSFVSHLHSALVKAEISTFKDDRELEKGEEISCGLLKAIDGSKMFVVVLSENYARSPWCLDELVEILNRTTKHNRVVPVFYYVDPSDLRHQRGSFGEALDYHMMRYSVDIIEKWKSALAEISHLSGYPLKKDADENESNIIHEIVENVLQTACTKESHLEEYLVGINPVVEEIYQKLSMESNDVRAIGICGMGGIGKTTTAKAFYNKYSREFDISCFIENEKQHSQGDISLLPLLNQLLIELLRRKDDIVRNVESGIKKLKQILSSKKALIVLDDPHRSIYSELLVRIHSLFFAGSRIIITTRDENLLNQSKVDISEVDIYMLMELDEICSLELFSYHAFRIPMPLESFKELAKSFVTYAGGVPLALKVLGSSLRGRTDVSFWKGKLKKLSKIPEKEIQKILQLSYDDLDDDTEKPMFLDIAFFFVGKDRDDAGCIFNSCDFFPDIGIPILIERCLISIDKDNKFQMHNLIRCMGLELGKSTRLFLRGNAWKDLQKLEERNDIEGLILDLSTSTDGQISALFFEKMYNLRLLQIIDARDIQGNFGNIENLFPKLRCIRWHHCPWTHMPSIFLPQNLISIEMPFSKFKILWKGLMPIKQLNNLGCLVLHGCLDLKRLPYQLGDMKALKKIDASFTSIEKLPDSVTQLKELSVLYLCGCEKLRKLPEQIGNMQGLRTFNASFTAIEKLPDSVTQLKELPVLDLCGCQKLRKLPEQIGNMQRLRTFNASYTAIQQLPDSVTQLKELSELYLRGCEKLRKLPEQFGNMQGLRIFNASETAIQQLPDSFVGLINLESLHLSECKNLRNLPNSIWKLKLLKNLNLWKCSKLERLPEQIGKMQCLEWLSASDTAIEEVPDSIGLLSKLRELRIGNSDCLEIQCVPENIWNLTSIQRLGLHSWDTFSLTLNISKLFNLKRLELGNCTSLGSSLPKLPLNLEQLIIRHHYSLEQLPDLLSLRKLEHLEICGCTGLQDLPDLSMLKELRTLDIKECSNLKSISLKPSSLQVGQPHPPFTAHLPNREVPEWFHYKSSGLTVSFDIPPSFGSNFLGLALWVVYTCKATDMYYPCIRAVITNNTESITENCPIEVYTLVGEEMSRVQCITGEKISMKSGDRIKVSIGSLTYSDYEFKVPSGEVKVKMFGVHMIQDGPSSSI